eukprot:Pompholyxophrys_punicea_v1_NODE_339_length_2208_cov_3.736647.p2 type:complete len:102 gc:universal NODE_339_length_2208_cov_3.736647:1560-1255(-)
MLTWPCKAACINAVIPPLSLALTSALHSLSSLFTISSLPLAAATIRSVSPFLFVIRGFCPCVICQLKALISPIATASHMEIAGLPVSFSNFAISRCLFAWA